MFCRLSSPAHKKLFLNIVLELKSPEPEKDREEVKDKSLEAEWIHIGLL